MESTATIFSATLKENKINPKLYTLIAELCFELSRKKLQHLKDEKSIQHRLGELFELYCHALLVEGLKNTRAINAVIDGLLKASSHDLETFLYKTIYEKEQLEKSILAQKQQIRANIAQAFSTLEAHIATMSLESKESALTALHDAKLRGVEMLGILKETSSEALLTTLEKGTDIEDTIYEISKNLSFQSICEGDLSKQRIMDISHTIISASIEIADEDLGHAREILEGTINGVREGITKSIDKFKNDLKFTPTEVMEELAEQDLTILRKELFRIDEHFSSLLEALATQSEGISSEIIREMLKEMNSSTAKIKRAATEAKEVIGERLDILKVEAAVLEKNLKEKAEKQLESLKQFEFEKEKAKQVAQEAKELGFRAWEVAKHMVDGAVKSAKEAMKKDEK